MPSFQSSVVAAAAAVLFIAKGAGSPTPSVVVNGTRHWEMNVTLTDDLTTTLLSGFTFNFSYPCNHATPPPPTGGAGQACAKVTFIGVPCPGGTCGAEFCQGNLPQIQVVLPNGKVEYFNNATTIGGAMTYDSRKEPNHVHFIAGSSPTVGIERVTTHAPPNSLLLLVGE
ncbi:MAG: hypothetical protein JRN06_08265 [Nitrososphaerota archaeon]|nr:hypothetical protein [Nitrososphaerota archaeon]MDG7024223.1 hypothetical protein [Nitrososphaerota archaeon]